MDELGLNKRAAIFAALGEPTRLDIVDRLVIADLSPGELAAQLHLGTNLLAHHLNVLEGAGIIRRIQSEGDRRRSYVQLNVEDGTVQAVTHGSTRSNTLPSNTLPSNMLPSNTLPGVIGQVLFVCTANSARSQIAAATWNSVSGIPATSAGTHPASRVHPQAIQVARRHGLELAAAVPSQIDDLIRSDRLVVAVCDSAHEELRADWPRIHWSVPDPVRGGDGAASFEAAFHLIDNRVRRLASIKDDRQEAS